MLKVAVIGCGYWGKNLVRNFYELGVLDTVCDSDANALRLASAQYPNIKTTIDIDQVLKSKKIKAVAIATPVVTHYKLAKKAILAGKDVFVEKPLTLTTGEAEELIRLAKKKEKFLMVGHILQYHPAVIKLKELISNGKLGEIRYIYSNRLNLGKLRTDENILWSFAPHDISAMLMLMGEEPLSVNSFGGDYLNPGINDVTVTTFEFKNGVKGHIFVSWLHPYKEQKFVVVGSAATAVFDDVSKEKLVLYPNKVEWRNGKIPILQKADHKVIPFDAGEPLKLELQHFTECVEKRIQPKTSGEEGLRVLKILEAAEKLLKPHTSNPVHKTALVDEDCEIGEGTRIWHFSHIIKGSRIGRNCRIGQNVVIGPKVKIGDGCKIQNNVSIYKGVELEAHVFCGPSMVFTNVYNPRAFIERKNEFSPTLVKKGATIGANATIICGTTIGRYAFIGAGAVVKKDVHDYALMAGVPAKQIGWACKCGATLRFNKNYAKCKYCNDEYALHNGRLKIKKK